MPGCVGRSVGCLAAGGSMGVPVPGVLWEEVSGVSAWGVVVYGCWEQQPKGASWFCLRSEVHFCLITSVWPASHFILRNPSAFL